MLHTAAFHQDLHCLSRVFFLKDLQTKNTIFFNNEPGTPRYVQLSTPSLLYQNRRKNPFVYTTGADKSSSARGLNFGLSFPSPPYCVCEKGRL